MTEPEPHVVHALVDSEHDDGSPADELAPTGSVRRPWGFGGVLSRVGV